MVKSININHSDASLLTNDGSYIQLSKNGGVKVGFGKNLEESTVNNVNQNTLIRNKYQTINPPKKNFTALIPEQLKPKPKPLVT